MFGRTILGVLAVIALVGLVAVIGTSVYNAGVSQGIAEAANAAAASGDPVVVYPPYVGGHYGYGNGGWGFGFFGIFFWILGFFLIFGLLRAAFGWGRWGGYRGGYSKWGGHHDGPRDYLDQWHRERHGESPETPAPDKT